MAQTVSVAAEERPLGRKCDLKQVRREGKVPAVLYGKGIEPRTIQLPSKELESALSRHGHSTILELQLDGERLTAIIKEMDLHYMTGHVQHLGLQNIRMSDTIHTTVPIVLVGTASAIEDGGGVLEQPLTELVVTGRADQLPEAINVDITSMTMGDTLRVANLELPEGITTTVDPDQVIATASISAAARQEAADAAEAEAAEAPAGEGEAGEES